MTEGLPHFLCIGAQRSGTSWLYDNLRQVPGLWLPPVKELHYFDRIDPDFYRNPSHAYRRFHPHLRDRLARNARNLGALVPRLAAELAREGLRLPLWGHAYYFGKPSDEWYRGLFRSAAARGLITGEITPALNELVESGIVRVVDLVFIAKDDDGTVTAVELNELDSEVSDAYLTLVAELDSLIGEEDIEDFGDELEPGSSIALLVVDRLLDMSRTAVNIYSDSCAAVVIAKSEGEDLAVGVMGAGWSRLLRFDWCCRSQPVSACAISVAGLPLPA